MIIQDFINAVKNSINKACNKLVRKKGKSIFFYPHPNCRYDDYDIINYESSNVLCLFNGILKDPSFNEYQLFILYFHKDRLALYLDYCKSFLPERIHFVSFDNKSIRYAFFKCNTIFTDTDYTRIKYRISSQRVICLNYFGGLIKGEFFRWESHGGFHKMLKEQKEMYKIYDYHLSISDICSKFIALDNCHYYPHFVSLGFPRNDIFFKDNSALRKQIEDFAGFKVNRIITYVPTHRDYENPLREFYDKTKKGIRSVFGEVTDNELNNFESVLSDTSTLIIAKVHPIQQKAVIANTNTKHVVFYSELSKRVQTSLNPLLAISDGIITDYTTAVYDFLYTGRPIIYYFYDIEQYRSTRGFFIEPIESICAGHLTYNLSELGNAVRDIAQNKDPWHDKRLFLQQLFIKDLDGNSTDRIKKFFFKSNKA